MPSNESLQSKFAVMVEKKNDLPTPKAVDWAAAMLNYSTIPGGEGAAAELLFSLAKAIDRKWDAVAEAEDAGPSLTHEVQFERRIVADPEAKGNLFVPGQPQLEDGRRFETDVELRERIKSSVLSEAAPSRCNSRSPVSGNQQCFQCTRAAGHVGRHEAAFGSILWK